MRVPSAKRLMEAFRDLDKKNANLIRAFAHAVDDPDELRKLVERVPQTDQYVRQLYSSPYRSAMWRRTVALHAIDVLVEGFGVESIPDEDDDPRRGPRYEYINLGDTYATTLIYDSAKDNLFIGSWGDVVERRGNPESKSDRPKKKGRIPLNPIRTYEQLRRGMIVQAPTVRETDAYAIEISGEHNVIDSGTYVLMRDPDTDPDNVGDRDWEAHLVEYDPLTGEIGEYWQAWDNAFYVQGTPFKVLGRMDAAQLHWIQKKLEKRWASAAKQGNPATTNYEDLYAGMIVEVPTVREDDPVAIEAHGKHNVIEAGTYVLLQDPDTAEDHQGEEGYQDWEANFIEYDKRTGKFGEYWRVADRAFRTQGTPFKVLGSLSEAQMESVMRKLEKRWAKAAAKQGNPDIDVNQLFAEELRTLIDDAAATGDFQSLRLAAKTVPRSEGVDLNERSEAQLRDNYVRKALHSGAMGIRARLKGSIVRASMWERETEDAIRRIEYIDEGETPARFKSNPEVRRIKNNLLR